MKRSEPANLLTRRSVLAGLGAGFMLVSMPVRADDASVAEAIEAAFGDAPRTDGRIAMTLPPVAESGNTVPLTVSIESPMTEADSVKRVMIFANRNPRPLIATMAFGPKAAKAEFSTNIRLSGTQDVIAIAEMTDGTIYQAQVRVMVTVGACDTLKIRF